MFLPNPKWDAIRSRSCSFDLAKTFPNKPLRNLRFFDFAPGNHISVVQCNSGPSKVHENNHSTGWQRRFSNTTELEWVRRCVMSSTVFHQPPLPTGAARCVLFSQISSEMRLLKGQCPDCAHARASSVFSSKDNATVILLRQDFLPERTADEDLLFTISSNISDFRRRFSSYLKFGWRHEDSLRFCR